MQWLNQFVSWFSSPRTTTANGISSAFNWKFFLAVTLYLASFLAFAHDPFFLEAGAFVYQQGIVTLVLAFIISATFNWELCLFGKPVGANLLLHVLQLFPFSLFIARITSSPSQQPEPESYVGKFLQFLKDGFDRLFSDVINWIPAWLTDIFTNWKISLLLILVLFVLSIRNLRLKVSAILCILLLAFLGALTDKASQSSFLLLGTILLITGLALQFCRYDRMVYYENIFHRLQKSEQLDSLFTSVTLLIMTKLQTMPRLSENNLLGILKSECDPQNLLPDHNLKLAGQEILKKMIYEYNLIEIRNDSQGLCLEPDTNLFCNEGLLKQIPQIPRLILMALVAIVWILLPIDLIPDSIPFIGMLDDVAVTVLTGLAFASSTNDRPQQKRLH